MLIFPGYKKWNSTERDLKQVPFLFLALDLALFIPLSNHPEYESGMRDSFLDQEP